MGFPAVFLCAVCYNNRRVHAENSIQKSNAWERDMQERNVWAMCREYVEIYRKCVKMYRKCSSEKGDCDL